MYKTKKHYEEVFNELLSILNDNLTEIAMLKDISLSKAFATLKSSYEFDVENSDKINSLITVLSEKKFSQLCNYDTTVKSAVVIRAVCLLAMFKNNYFTPELLVSDDLYDELPTILIDLWDSCRPLVELEL